MTRTRWLIAVVAVLALGLIVELKVLSRLPTAEAAGMTVAATPFQCDSCGFTFGVPHGVNVYSPLVCPKCGKRAAVRCEFHEPLQGGDPVLVRCTKYTEEQLKFMEDYVTRIRSENADHPIRAVQILAATPPEAALAARDDGPMVRWSGTNSWIAFQNQPHEAAGVEDPRLKGYKAQECFPKDAEKWPVVPAFKFEQPWTNSLELLSKTQ